MDDVRAHRRQYRPRLVEIAGSAADHDRQGTRFGAADAARDRGIEKPDAALPEPRRHPLRGAGVDRRHVDTEPPGGDPLDDSAGPEISGRDIGRAGQHRDHQVSGRGGLCGGTGPLGAEPHRRIQCRRNRVVGDRLKPLLDEVGEHRLPHRSRPDKPDLHGSSHLKNTRLPGGKFRYRSNFTPASRRHAIPFMGRGCGSGSREIM